MKQTGLYAETCRFSGLRLLAGLSHAIYIEIAEQKVERVLFVSGQSVVFFVGQHIQKEGIIVVIEFVGFAQDFRYAVEQICAFAVIGRLRLKRDDLGDLFGYLAERGFEAHADRAELLVVVRHQTLVFQFFRRFFDCIAHGEFVEGHAVAAAAVRLGDDGVVFEILVVQGAVLVAQQAVFLHVFRVELDLRLHVFCHDVREAYELAVNAFLHVCDVIDHAVGSVAVLTQNFEFIVLIVIQARADHRQEHARLFLFFDQGFEPVFRVDAEVQVAVRDQDDLVVPAVPVCFFTDGVGGLDAGGAVGGSVDKDGQDVTHDVFQVAATADHMVREDRMVVGAVGDQAQDITFLQLRNDRGQRLERDVSLRRHAARSVQKEDDILMLLRRVVCLDIDIQKFLVFAFIHKLGVDLKPGFFLCICCLMIVIEVVQDLLDADLGNVDRPAVAALVQQDADRGRARGHPEGGSRSCKHGLGIFFLDEFVRIRGEFFRIDRHAGSRHGDLRYGSTGHCGTGGKHGVAHHHAATDHRRRHDHSCRGVGSCSAAESGPAKFRRIQK